MLGHSELHRNRHKAEIAQDLKVAGEKLRVAQAHGKPSRLPYALEPAILVNDFDAKFGRLLEL